MSNGKHRIADVFDPNSFCLDDVIDILEYQAKEIESIGSHDGLGSDKMDKKKKKKKKSSKK